MTKTGRKNDLVDKILFVVLASVLLIASLAITVQMLKPSERQTIIDELLQDGLAIISSSQSWVSNPDMNPDFKSENPFLTLRFDRLGHFEGVGLDGRTMVTSAGNYKIVVSGDSKSYDLELVGAEGITLLWKGVDTKNIPDVEIR